MKKQPTNASEAQDRGFRPIGLFRDAEELAAIVAKIPHEVVEDMDDESPGPMRWTEEVAKELIRSKACGLSATESGFLRRRIREQEKRDLGLFEAELATVVSQPRDARLGCPCRLVARWDAGKILIVQRYDPDLSDEDRELGVFDALPTLGEVIPPVGRILNDPEWLGAQNDVEVLPSWQETLGKLDSEQDWELRVISDAYPGLGDWFEAEWERVLRVPGNEPANPGMPE